jgi:hypothetical protein
MKAALSSDRLEIELTAPMDDQEQRTPARDRNAWNSIASGASIERPQTPGFVGEQQSRPALLLIVRSGAVVAGSN